MEQEITSPGGRHLKLREVTPGMDGRVWEVKEAEKGLRFKATLTGRALLPCVCHTCCGKELFLIGLESW